MNDKELRRELRRVRYKETEILTKNRYGHKINLESILNRFLPDTLEETLDAAFREAFKLIFAKGTGVIGKTFNEKKLREEGSSAADNQRRRTTDMVLTSVEGTGLGLMGVGLPDIPVFTAMLLRTVYQTAASYQFSYTSKTEQMYILHLIEAALTRGKETEKKSHELDELARKIDVEGFSYYGSMNDQIAVTSKALSDETLYLKFLQTMPVVGVAGGLSNPVYMNRIQNYAEVKYHKRRLMIEMRRLKAPEQMPEETKPAPEQPPESAAAPQEPVQTPESAAAPQEPESEPRSRDMKINIYDPEDMQ